MHTKTINVSVYRDMRKNTRKKQKTFRRTKLRQRGGEPTLESLASLASNMPPPPSPPPPPPTLTSIPPSPPSKRYLKVTFKNKGNSNNSNSSNNNDNDDSLIVVEIVKDIDCGNAYNNNPVKNAFDQFLDDYIDLENKIATEVSTTEVSASNPEPPTKILFLPMNNLYDKTNEITIKNINWNGDCAQTNNK